MRKALFAPWRMEFIEQNREGSEDCVLCEIARAGSIEDDAKLVVHRGDYSYVVLNRYPYTHGHLMVLPLRHEKDFEGLSPEEHKEMNALTSVSLRALKKVMSPQGFNIGINLGKPAGAGIEGHIHQHIVPRWVGDFNFMPVFGETKVISEHLGETYEKIKAAWEI